LESLLPEKTPGILTTGKQINSREQADEADPAMFAGFNQSNEGWRDRMPEPQVCDAATVTVEALQARVDELSTRLMVDGSEPATINVLRDIGSEARTRRAYTTVQVVDRLMALFEADPEAGAARLLQSGIAELQASLQAEMGQSQINEAPASLAEDPELIADFVVEAREHLSQIEGQMLVLERDPAVIEVIHAVFRAFHTIKGLAGFLDFRSVQALAHEVETLLDLARNDKLKVDPFIVDVVLESGDFLQTEIAAIERTLQGGSPLVVGDNRQLIGKIRALAICARPAGDGTPPPVSPAEEEPAAKEPERQNLTQPLQPVPMGSAIASTDQTAPELAPSTQVPQSSVSSPAGTSPQSASSQSFKHESVAPPVTSALPPQNQAKEPVRSPDAGSVRVETAKLDHLMDMVGEIVIAQSLVRHNHIIASATDSRLVADLSQLARVTVEMQRATMSMRMVPVGQLFQRVERVIRDLSRKAGKQIVLETSGTETGIDKTVAEELSDPLLHMVRNSVDHGIEPPAERKAVGKPVEARIRLSAYHQGGQVIIQISDDGRGLNSEKIRKKAEERELITAATPLTETEIYQLIFEPGFSTAEKITDVSGRGVGMDVVRRNVEKLRGRIETQSTLGQGTVFLLKLPLTLAIIDGLVVEVGHDRYIIPLAGVREMFRPPSDTLFTVTGRDEMLLVRGELLPVVRLHMRLGIAGRAKQPSEGLIVVAEAENHRFCLLVDDLVGKQEVVIKSLGECFKGIPCLSGCAVLGDGRVGLILDVDGLYRGYR
jgi:two-component system chemotaxis sensor kinase CheA